MDKLEFIERAPGYYVVGIIVALSKLGEGLVTSDAIKGRFDPAEDYFRNNKLWEVAVAILHSHGVIDIISDDFGPTLYKSRSPLDKWLEDTAPNLYSWYPKYTAAGDGWLKAALWNINNQYIVLSIRDDEFDFAAEVEWEPIPINAEDPGLKSAIEAID
jgi:hypothetical protein